MTKSSRGADDIPPRHELKYLIPLWQAEEIRKSIAPFCVLDPYSAQSPTGTYVVTSLYLDTPHLGCFRAWELGAPHRFKLRVRRYGDAVGDSPVFLEVKERFQDVTIKQRSIVPAAEWLARARDGDGAAASPSSQAAERAFTVRRDRFRMEPKMLVRYERQAWKGALEAYARVTFDARVQFQHCEHWSLDGDGGGWRAGDDVDTVDEPDARILLEIKFEEEVPRWLAHVARSLELVRRGYSKYGTATKLTFDKACRVDAANREPLATDLF